MSGSRRRRIRALDSVAGVGVETGERATEAAVVPDVREVAREVAFVLYVANYLVADTGRDEYLVE